MGYDAYACVVLGIRIEEEKLYTEERIRGCQHAETEAAFCPECGSPMWRIEPVPLAGYEPDDLEWAGYDVVHETMNADFVYIGKQLCRVGARDPAVGLGSVDYELADELAGFFLHHGLWKPEDFGLWVFLYESY